MLTVATVLLAVSCSEDELSSGTNGDEVNVTFTTSLAGAIQSKTAGDGANVDKVAYAYSVVFNAFKRLSKDYSTSERTALFHDTAARVYRIAV